MCSEGIDGRLRLRGEAEIDERRHLHGGCSREKELKDLLSEGRHNYPRNVVLFSKPE
jgi:hypothetical protein